MSVRLGHSRFKKKPDPRIPSQNAEEKVRLVPPVCFARQTSRTETNKKKYDDVRRRSIFVAFVIQKIIDLVVLNCYAHRTNHHIFLPLLSASNRQISIIVLLRNHNNDPGFFFKVGDPPPGGGPRRTLPGCEKEA